MADSLDYRILSAIRAALPADVPVSYGYVPQEPTETKPTALPFVVVQRGAVEPQLALCGNQGFFLSVDVIVVARRSEDCWELSRDCTAAVLPLADATAVIDGYDPDLRAWAVTTTWREMSDE